MTGQSFGNQNYVPPVLVVPEYQFPATQIGASQPLGNISCPKTNVPSYPNTGAHGYAHGSTTTPAWSNFPDPGSSQGYQLQYSGGQPYQCNYISSPAVPVYASYSPPATGQPSQVDERFQGAQPNPYVANNDGSGYYDPRYWPGHSPMN